MIRHSKRLWLAATAIAGVAGAGHFAWAQDALATSPPAQVNGPMDPRDAEMTELRVQLQQLAVEVAALRQESGAGIKKLEAAQATMPKVTWKGAPEFSGPGGSSFKVRGRVLVDGVFQNWEPEGTVADLDTREFRGRQIFLGVEGKLSDRLAYKVEGGWANGSNPTWDDAYLEYKPSKNSSILFGNAKAAGLENITSTRFVTFLERGPYANVAGLDYNLGVVARTWGKNWTLTGAIQGDSLNTADVLGEETLSEVVRATFAPVLNDATTVHLGAWARHRDHGTGPALGYTPRPNTAFIPGGIYSLKGTGSIGDSDNTLGLEGLLLHRQFSLQSEYVHLSYEGLDPAPDGDIDAGYLFGSWFIGGRRTYSVAPGEIARPKIARGITDGGWGALELAVRYDFADISGSPTAGDYDGWTLGANYYPSGYVRFMLNYTDGQQQNPLALDDIDVRSLQLRAQLDF